MDWKSEDVSAFLRDYGAGRLHSAEEIEQGEDNLNLRLETDRGAYVLRQYRQRPAEEVGFEVGFIRHLVGAGFPTPAPLPQKSGAVLGAFGGRPAALFEFVRGRQVRADPALCAEVGGLLARLHRVGASYRPAAPRLDERRADMARLIALRADHIAGLDGMKRVVAAYGEEVGPALQALRPALPRGPIHYDLNPTNLLADEGGRLAWVLDFDSSCVDAWALDIAVLMQYWANEQARFELDPARAHLLLEGYQQARPLQAAEKEALPYLVLYMYLSEAAGYILHKARAGRPYAVQGCHTYSYYCRLRQMFGRGELRFLGA